MTGHHVYCGVTSLLGLWDMTSDEKAISYNFIWHFWGQIIVNKYVSAIPLNSSITIFCIFFILLLLLKKWLSNVRVLTLASDPWKQDNMLFLCCAPSSKNQAPVNSNTIFYKNLFLILDCSMLHEVRISLIAAKNCSYVPKHLPVAGQFIWLNYTVGNTHST